MVHRVLHEPCDWVPVLVSGSQDTPPTALHQRMDCHLPPLVEQLQLRQGGPYQEVPAAEPLGYRVVVAVIGDVPSLVVRRLKVRVGT